MPNQSKTNHTNTDGRRWARTFLALALFVSVVGNVAHTVLADSTISLWLRVPGAVVWPLFTFGGIEIVVRMIWERSFTHRLGRNMVLLPAVPAAITSYQHLYSLLLMMGEERFIAFIGPLAIDGMMIGCTMVLLFTRPRSIAAELDAIDREWSTAELDAIELPPPSAPTSPAPVTWTQDPAPENPSSSRIRAGSQAQESAVRAMLAGTMKLEQVAQEHSVGLSTLRRYAKVHRTLHTNPHALIDVRAEKVRPELVNVIREHARAEATR
jgi:hypothetical protein